MAILGPAQKPIVMVHYPHMMPEDTDVWTRFLKERHLNITKVWYDVRVGSMVFMGPEASEMETRIAAGLTRKRIDAVVEVAGETWVIEVKPYANMYAVGQVITYVRLFEQEYEHIGELRAVIVCDDYDSDLVEEFDEFEVLVLKNPI